MKQLSFIVLFEKRKAGTTTAAVDEGGVIVKDATLADENDVDKCNMDGLIFVAEALYSDLRLKFREQLALKIYTNCMRFTTHPSMKESKK